MDTIRQNPIDFSQMPKREDGIIDFAEIARAGLENTLNEFMSVQVDAMYGEIARNGYRERSLQTMLGKVTLRIPKLREGSYFPDEIIRPYSRVDRAVVGAIREIYVAGLSNERIVKAAGELEFGRLSSGTVSRMCATLDEEVATLTEGILEDVRCPYLWLDATYLKCRSDGHVTSMALVTAIAANVRGERMFVGLQVVDTESKESWRGLLRKLRRRGLKGVACIVSDAHAGLVTAIREVFPGTSWQRCIVHFERDMLAKVKKKADKATVAKALKAVFAQREPALVREMYSQATDRIAAIKPSLRAAMEDAEPDVLNYLSFPYAHHVRLRTNNIQERANREIKRRTQVVQIFPSEKAMTRLVGAVCLDVNERWMESQYMDAEGMEEAYGTAKDPEPASKEVRAEAKALLDSALGSSQM